MRRLFLKHPMPFVMTDTHEIPFEITIEELFIFILKLIQPKEVDQSNFIEIANEMKLMILPLRAAGIGDFAFSPSSPKNILALRLVDVMAYALRQLCVPGNVIDTRSACVYAGQHRRIGLDVMFDAKKVHGARQKLLDSLRRVLLILAQAAAYHKKYDKQYNEKKLSCFDPSIIMHIAMFVCAEYQSENLGYVEEKLQQLFSIVRKSLIGEPKPPVLEGSQAPKPNF